MSADQLPLPLPVRPALGRDDFIVSPANAVAVTQIDAWPDWPGGKLLLVGPPKSGKTHLAHVWADRCGARVISARDLCATDVPALAAGPVCVEDAGRIAGNAEIETALFHLHNLVLAEGNSLLVTDRRPPTRWGLGLPDLSSRMQGTALTRLDPPDDVLLGAVLEKLFGDRQIRPPADVIPYLLTHMPRAFSAADWLVAALDRAALEGAGKGVTRSLARRVLLEQPESWADDDGTDPA